MSDLGWIQPDAHSHVDQALDAAGMRARRSNSSPSLVNKAFCPDADRPPGRLRRTDSSRPTSSRLWRQGARTSMANGPTGQRSGIRFHDLDAAKPAAFSYGVVDVRWRLPLRSGPLHRLPDLPDGRADLQRPGHLLPVGSLPLRISRRLHRRSDDLPTTPPSLLASLRRRRRSEALSPVRTPSLSPGSHRCRGSSFGEDWSGSAERTRPRPRCGSPDRDVSERIHELGLEVRALTCSRGDTFLWHAGLLHGGLKVTDPTQTRKSFVTHYSTAAAYKRRRASMLRHPRPAPTSGSASAERPIT